MWQMVCFKHFTQVWSACKFSDTIHLCLGSSVTIHIAPPPTHLLMQSFAMRLKALPDQAQRSVKKTPQSATTQPQKYSLSPLQHPHPHPHQSLLHTCQQQKALPWTHTAPEVQTAEVGAIASGHSTDTLQCNIDTGHLVYFRGNCTKFL